METNKKKELFRAIKYILIAASAGIIQTVTTVILDLIWPKEVFAMGPALFYLIGLILSVIWNLTINKKYNFKAAGDLGKAVWLTVIFYAVFAPASTLLQAWLVNGNIFDIWLIPHLGLHEFIGLAICMILNLGLEYPWQRYVLFKNNIDTNDVAKKEKK